MKFLCHVAVVFHRLFKVFKMLVISILGSNVVKNIFDGFIINISGIRSSCHLSYTSNVKIMFLMTALT